MVTYSCALTFVPKFCRFHKFQIVAENLLTIVRKCGIISSQAKQKGRDAKKMCSECGKLHCTPNCPNYTGQRANGGRVFGACAICGDVMYYSDDAFRKSIGIICGECACGGMHAPALISTRFKLK